MERRKKREENEREGREGNDPMYPLDYAHITQLRRPQKTDTSTKSKPKIKQQTAQTDQTESREWSTAARHCVFGGRHIAASCPPAAKTLISRHRLMYVGARPVAATGIRPADPFLHKRPNALHGRRPTLRGSDARST